MYMPNIPPLSSLRTQRAVELCSSFEPSLEARALLASASDVGPFLDLLLGQRLWRDAALMLAHGLQKRTAVWWACVICRNQFSQLANTPDIENSYSSAREMSAIEAAENWVRDPQEKYRIAACVAATAAGNRTPAHWASMAAFWSTGNMTPEAGVVTPPPPFLHALAVVSALDFAAARCGKRREEFFSDALRRGISLASGGDGS